MLISGDKVNARRIASRVAPVVDGGEISNKSNATGLIERIGYPVILKAVEGGGRRGLRIVKSSKELKEELITSKNESNIIYLGER